MTAGEDPAGGDPVCWLHLACPECGAIPDPGEEDSERCPRCGIAKVDGDTRELGSTG
jgi:ribosomal protein S27AE